MTITRGTNPIESQKSTTRLIDKLIYKHHILEIIDQLSMIIRNPCR